MRLRAFWKKWGVSYLFAAPYVLLFLLFTVVPVLVAITLSFTSYNMLQPPVWVGWANYVKLLFADDVFLIAVKNTLLFAAITGPLSYMLCLLLAWFINELKPNMRTILTLLFYAPSISGNVFMIWTILFSGDMYGWVNSVSSAGESFYAAGALAYRSGYPALGDHWLRSDELGHIVPLPSSRTQGIDESLQRPGPSTACATAGRNCGLSLSLLCGPSCSSVLSSDYVLVRRGKPHSRLGRLPSTDYAGHTVITHLMDYGNIRFEMGYASAIATLLFVAMLHPAARPADARKIG